MKVKAGLIQMSLKGDTSMSPEEITCLKPSDFNCTVNVLMTSESTPVISKRLNRGLTRFGKPGSPSEVRH
ncbi:MAG: hypothetical protein OSB18_09830 [SAR324 cluster bacterium]|nr:hypothetical protein [SAR324 cluster bacterium]